MRRFFPQTPRTVVGQAVPVDPGLAASARDKDGNGVYADRSSLTLNGTSDGTCGYDGAVSTERPLWPSFGHTRLMLVGEMRAMVTRQVRV